MSSFEFNLKAPETKAILLLTWTRKVFIKRVFIGRDLTDFVEVTRFKGIIEKLWKLANLATGSIFITLHWFLLKLVSLFKKFEQFQRSQTNIMT